MAGKITPIIPKEIELKLELTAPALKGFRASSLFQKMGLDRAPKHKLRSTYFDTPDHQLKAHKIALRVRDDGQGQLIQTLKTRGVPGDIVPVREEHEIVLTPQDPLPNLDALPDTWRGLVKDLAAQSQLQPLFETQIRRQAALMTTVNGDEIEVALDQGWVIAGANKHQIREVEFEFVAGRPEALYEVALDFVQTTPARIGTISKSQRGYYLPSSHEPSPHRHVAHKAVSVELTSSQTVEEALSILIRQSVRQIMANEPVIVEAKQPEGVHQMRVALRRLRTGLQDFARWLGDPELMAFSIEAKTLAARLGGARDMDVFETEIIFPILNDFPNHPGIEKLLRRSKSRRAVAWKECGATVTSNEFVNFLLRLNLYVEQKAWQTHAVEKSRLSQPVLNMARHILGRRRAKLDALTECLDTLSIEERHEFRKRIKKLRYTSVFFSSVFSSSEQENEARKIYLKKLAKLQNRFGALNDVAMAEVILTDLFQTIGRKSSDLSEAFGLIVGWHMHRAHREWKRTPPLWEGFSETPGFWEA